MRQTGIWMGIVLSAAVAWASAAEAPATKLARVAAVVLEGKEHSLYSGVIDAANGYVYFGTDTAPGQVVKIRVRE